MTPTAPRPISASEMELREDLRTKRAALLNSIPAGLVTMAHEVEAAAFALGMEIEREILSDVYGIARRATTAPACENCNNGGCARCGVAA